nr:hypothetical protein [Morchella crassipes]
MMKPALLEGKGCCDPVLAPSLLLLSFDPVLPPPGGGGGCKWKRRSRGVHVVVLAAPFPDASHHHHSLYFPWFQGKEGLWREAAGGPLCFFYFPLGLRSQRGASKKKFTPPPSVGGALERGAGGGAPPPHRRSRFHLPNIFQYIGMMKPFSYFFFSLLFLFYY